LSPPPLHTTPLLHSNCGATHGVVCWRVSRHTKHSCVNTNGRSVCCSVCCSARAVTVESSSSPEIQLTANVHTMVISSRITHGSVCCSAVCCSVLQRTIHVQPMVISSRTTYGAVCCRTVCCSAPSMTVDNILSSHTTHSRAPHRAVCSSAVCSSAVCSIQRISDDSITIINTHTSPSCATHMQRVAACCSALSMTVEPPLSAAAQLTPAHLNVQCVAAQYDASQSVAASIPAMTVEPSSSTPTHLPAVQLTCSVSQTSSSCAGHLQCIAAQYVAAHRIAAQNVFQRTSNDSRAVITISHTTHSRTGCRSQRKRHGRRRSSCISGCCS